MLSNNNARSKLNVSIVVEAFFYFFLISTLVLLV